MRKRLFLSALALTFTASVARADVVELSKKVAGTTVQYKVVRPDGYDASKALGYTLTWGSPPLISMATTSNRQGLASSPWRARKSAAVATIRRRFNPVTASAASP